MLVLKVLLAILMLQLMMVMVMVYHHLKEKNFTMATCSIIYFLRAHKDPSARRAATATTTEQLPSSCNFVAVMR